MLLRDELNEIKRENAYVRIRTSLNILNLYLRYLVMYPKELKLRRKIFELMRGFFTHLKYESEILNRMTTADITQEDFDDMITSLEALYYARQITIMRF